MLLPAPDVRRGDGFTMVEVLIVVMLLGILAMIVIPRFTDASEQARESALATDLQTLRRQIEIYTSEHNGRGPHIDHNGNLDPVRLVARLTGRTATDGRIDDDGPHGPYIRRWPANPFVPDPIARTVRFGEGPPPRDGTSGWYFDTRSGMLYVNSVEGPG